MSSNDKMDTKKEKSIDEIKQMLDDLEKRIEDIKIPKIDKKMEEKIEALAESAEPSEVAKDSLQEGNDPSGQTVDSQQSEAASDTPEKSVSETPEESVSETPEKSIADTSVKLAAGTSAKEPEASQKEEEASTGANGKNQETDHLELSKEDDYNALEDETLDEVEEKKSHWLRNTVLVLLFLLVIAYGATSYYFTDHFFYNTVIWGQDCSFKKVDEVKELVRKSISGYQITLNERDGQSEVLTAKQLELDLMNDGSIEGMLESQSPFQWITCFWKEFDYKQSVNLNLSKEKLTEMVNALKAEQKENVVTPVNAYYTYDKKAKKYLIIPEVEGNSINNDILIPALEDAILSKKTSFDFEEIKCYYEPEIRKDNEDLIKESNALNEYLATNIVYDFGSDRKEVVGADRLKGWISLNDKQEVVLDKSKVKEFVEYLAEKYDTLGRKRQFKSINGKTVKVTGGTYGWKIDQEKEYKKLVKLIKKHKQGDREPIYTNKAKSREKNDLGKTYVEIDISKQHMWYYKKGKTLVSTAIVTGDETKGRGTPTGVYYILYKQQTMY